MLRLFGGLDWDYLYGTPLERVLGIPAGAGAVLADCNEDGALNNFDIDAFVALLTGG